MLEAYAKDQVNFSPGIFEQTRAGALMAWKRSPTKGSSDSSITNVKQVPDEPFSGFVTGWAGFHCLQVVHIK